MRTFEYMMELFLVHRKQIRHRDPQVTVAFALMTLSSTLIELILVDHDLRCWQAVIPKDDQTLRRDFRAIFSTTWASNRGTARWRRWPLSRRDVSLC